MIFARRGDRGEDPFLRAKVQAFFAAAALALIGIGVDSSLLVGVAILILTAGMLFRFLPGKKKPASAVDSPHDEDGPAQDVQDPQEPESGEPPQ